MSQPKHKNQVRNRLFIDSQVFEYEGLQLSLRGEQIKENVYINFNKIKVNFEIFCLHLTGYSNTKESFRSCMFVVMATGKCEPHTYFTFLQRILTFTHMKKSNIFCIIYVAMSNIHFSGLDNVKMTCITLVSFKITIRKRHVYIDIR